MSNAASSVVHAMQQIQRKYQRITKTILILICTDLCLRNIN